MASDSSDVPRQPESPAALLSLPSLLHVTALLIVLCVGLLLSWHSLGVLDIWLHDKVGRDILAGEGFPSTNSYSYTEPEHPWTNHEWLFQVMVAALGPAPQDDPYAGIQRWNLLRLVLGGILLLILLLEGSGLGRRPRRPVGWARTWLALPLLGGLMLLWPRLVLRPELLSFLFFLLLVRTLDRPLSTWMPQGNWADLVHPARPVGRAFWLTVLWAQFHGFAALAPFIFLLAGVCSLLEKHRGRHPAPASGQASRWWLGLPLLIVTLALTPNGLAGLTYPLRALSQFGHDGADLRRTISELVPLLDTRDSLGWTLIAYRVSLVWGVAWIVLTWPGISLLRALLWTLAAAAAYAGQRNIGLYAVTFLLLHTGPVRVWLPGPAARWVQRPWGPVLGPAGLVLAGVAALAWGAQIIGNDFYLREGVSRRFGSGASVARYPEETARLLGTRPGLRLFTNVDGAAYLLNRTSSRLFIDGRTEAYSPGHWKLYGKIRAADDRGLDLLERSRPQAVFLATGGAAFRPLAQAMLASEAWQLVHRDPTGLLFQPRTATPLASTGTAPFRHFGKGLPEPDSTADATRGADLCLAWATVMELGGNSRLQERALRRGLELQPDHPPLLHNLGNLLLARGDLDGALPLFTAALEANPRLSGSALNAGVCQLRSGNAGAAEEMFRRATEITPGSFEAWANLGTSRLAQRDHDGARKALRRALALQPGNHRVRDLLRQLDSQRG